MSRSCRSSTAAKSKASQLLKTNLNVSPHHAKLNERERRLGPNFVSPTSVVTFFVVASSMQLGQAKKSAYTGVSRGFQD
eukprot:1125440-Amphidinium_carterae.1